MPGDAEPLNDHLEALLAAALNDRRAANRLRSLRIVRPLDAVHVEIDGVPYVNFCSNNYLGLTHHPRVIDAMTRATQAHGAGSAASALISGYTHEHASAERSLAAWKGTEAAVLLPSGYQANHAAVQTIAAIVPGQDPATRALRSSREGRGLADGRASHAADDESQPRSGQARPFRARSARRDSESDPSPVPLRFLLDKLSHASLIDAVRATGLPMRAFPHNDLAKLARLLDEAEPTQLQVVVTESIFSMDGDAVPLAGFADLKRVHPFVLVLDEAHGSGVYGGNGAGLAAELKLTDAVDVFVVTLSKALGCVGGAICASRNFCNAVANFGRAYVYSTAVPPGVAAGCAAAIEVMRDEPARQRRVRALAARVRGALALDGDSPIVPVVLGDESTAIAAGETLRGEGLLVLPVRPPTVPRGTSRLRVTLSSEHTDGEVDRLIGALRGCVARESPDPKC